MNIFNYLTFQIASRLCRPGHGFAAATAAEPTVFGARRPGFPLPRVHASIVARWIEFMQSQQITRVVCLLPPQQLRAYSDLLGTYQQQFGPANVCWSPINDFTLADASDLIRVIMPFLADAERQGQRVVIHCSGGIGRTGHVLAAWLVGARGMSNEQAIQAVRQTGRNPRESRDPRLDQLLDTCRDLFAPEG